MADNFLTLWNLLRTGDIDTGAQNSELLGDLRDRASYLAKKTGQEPVSFYEFKMQHPPEQPRSVRNALIGAAIMATILGFLMGPVGVVSGILLGALGGAFVDTQNRRRTGVVQSYSNYLDNFEHQIVLQSGMAQSMQPTRDDHAKRYLASLTEGNNRGIS